MYAALMTAGLRPQLSAGIASAIKNAFSRGSDDSTSPSLEPWGNFREVVFCDERGHTVALKRVRPRCSIPS